MVGLGCKDVNWWKQKLWCCGGEGALSTEKEDRKREGAKEQHVAFTQEKYFPKTTDWGVERN